MRNCNGVPWQDWRKPPASFDRCWESTWVRRVSAISAPGTCSISGGRSLQLSRSASVSARVTLTAFVILGIAGPNCKSEEVSVDLDPAKTQIAFTVSDTLHTVRGKFRLKQGHLS